MVLWQTKMHTATAFPRQSKGRAPAVPFPELRNTHRIITQNLVFFSGPALTRAPPLELHEPHKSVRFAYKQPSARLCRDINNAYCKGSAGLWAPVGLKKLLPLMIRYCSTLIMETLLKFDDKLPNKIWSLCGILSNKAGSPVFPSMQPKADVHGLNFHQH